MATLKISDLLTAARSGDRLATLKALRERLALAIEESERGADIAALSLRLTDVLKQIDELGDGGEQQSRPDVVNEVLERAKKRKAS